MCIRLVGGWLRFCVYATQPANVNAGVTSNPVRQTRKEFAVCDPECAGSCVLSRTAPEAARVSRSAQKGDFSRRTLSRHINGVQ